MHPFHEHLCQQLDELLKKQRIVVVYDPRREFERFFGDELMEAGTGYDGLPRVFVKDRLTFLARFDGSFFALRNAVEPIADLDQPDPLIVYVPGMSRDRHASVLMELEKGGTAYEPQLKRMAINVLRKRFTDGQIDEMLRPENVRYDDIVSFLRQGEEGAASASLLRTIFDGAQSEALIARWLADDNRDAAIVEKDAGPELFKLVESRLALAIAAGTSVAESREKTLRYVLVCEFRSDLGCDPPSSVSLIPAPPDADSLAKTRQVAELLRRDHSDRYVKLADKVETALNLAHSTIDASKLGHIDTFRFEERALLAHAGELIASGDYESASTIAAGRRRSFWVDRDVDRQLHWEACRLMAELGAGIERVRPALAKTADDPAAWVSTYAADDGWYRVDAIHRRLEAWVARTDAEAEGDRAIAVVRREYEELLKRMADGFTKAIVASNWNVSGHLHQTHIYPEVVEAMGGRVAYFFVDAMRFEMGVELAKQLEGAEDLTVRPAIVSLPSITPVGMAAILPGASKSFSVVEQKGKLAAKIDKTVMTTWADRWRYLKSQVADAVEMPLGKVLGTSASKLESLVRSSSLVIVRSQEIDFMGENDGDLLARQVMDTVIGNLARAVKKLAGVGISNFVITADHGHQFSIRKDDDMKTDNPGGDTLDVHRRCWIGHGGSTPSGTVRVTGTDLGYDTDLDFIFPKGLGVFKTGGGLSFHHGGTSLQEMVVPVISLRMRTRVEKPPAGNVAELIGIPDAITNRTFGVRLMVTAQTLLGQDTGGQINVRVILMSGSEEVGKAGMAIAAELEPDTGVLRVNPGVEASVGLMLKKDDCESVRIVVLDPATDAVLAQSDELPVKLGI